jgi:DNA-binding IclR family transcriptional regulator
MDWGKKESFYNRSLERSLQILNAFNHQRTVLTLSQLSEILNLPKATVLRLCSTLVKYGFLKHDPKLKRYSLGLRLFELGSIVFYSLSLRHIASTHLSQLQLKLGKTIFLGILDNDELLYIDKREDPRNPINFTSKIGTRRPPYWGMVGQMLMACLPEDEIERLLQKNPLTSNTKNSITNKEEFKEWLRQVSKQGFAIDLETTFEGISGVAVPVRNHTGKVIASIGICFISSTVDSKGLKEIVKEARGTALTISTELGYFEKKRKQAVKALY